MSQGNKQWQIQLPVLAGVNPMDPTRVRLPTGAYEGVIVSSEQSTDPTKNSIRFDVKITEAGPYANSETSIFMGLDFSKDGNKKSWKSLMLSIGATEAHFAQNINAGPQSFNGKKVYLYVQAAPEGEKDARDNRNFVTFDIYQKQKASAQAQANVAGAVAGASAPAFNPQLGTAPAAAPAFGGAPTGAPPAFGGAPAPVQNGGVAAFGGAPLPGAPVAGVPVPGNGGVNF